MSVSFHFGNFIFSSLRLRDFLYDGFRLQGKTGKTFKKCKQTYYVIFSYFRNFVGQNQKRKMEWKEHKFPT